MKKKICLLLGVILTLGGVVSMPKTASDVQAETFSEVMVHDPSIVYPTKENGLSEYYVFGSHMAVASSKDLMHFTQVNQTENDKNSTMFGIVQEGSVVPASYEEAFHENMQKGEVTFQKETGEKYTVNFGDYDAAKWMKNNGVGGNMWAPDVIYNPVMKQWCMYLSLNGQGFNSSIILLTANEVTGPYVYQGPVIYSGFQFANNKKELTGGIDNSDLPLVVEEADYSRYTTLPSGKQWGDIWPHAIDPCVFYDEEGKLWMSYGSWSGGIYMIELDETNGLRDYSVTYDSDYAAKKEKVTTDAYFGKKIAGGCYVSGEGSYIEHIGDYYYLFMSYGFYSPWGGYSMRVFRSENPCGPYVDNAGKSAIYESYANNFTRVEDAPMDSRGVQLMGNYQWEDMTVAEAAQGHNSAFVDENGNAYLVYHTKFGDDSVNHQVRVHKMYVNEEGWLVVSPYRYAGENTTIYDSAKDKFSTKDIAGDYQLMYHRYISSSANTDPFAGPNQGNFARYAEVSTPRKVTLSEDGKVSGEYIGSWLKADGTSYAMVKVAGQEYKGVFLKGQTDVSKQSVLTFTGVNDKGQCIWLSKPFEETEDVTNTAKVTLSKTKYIYNGKVQRPSVQVTTADGRKLVKDKDYKVTYTGDCKNAKKHSVKITFTGSYVGQITKSYTIAKAKQSMSVSVSSKVYKQSALKKKGAKLTISVKKSQGKVTYSLKNKKYMKITSSGKLTIDKKIKKGTYEVIITAKGNSNYEPMTKKVKIIVK